jgi:hypothetical protein
VGPAHDFAAGLRLNTLDALRLGVPALVVVGIVATTVVHRDAAGISGAYALVLVSIALVVVLWTLEALLLASLFAFRARDVARLALHHLASRPRVTVGLLALVVVAAGVVWFAGEAVLALVLVVWAAFLLRTGRPVIDDVRDRFVG